MNGGNSTNGSSFTNGQGMPGFPGGNGDRFNGSNGSNRSFGNSSRSFGGGQGFMMPGMPGGIGGAASVNEGLLAYLKKNQSTDYLLAVSDYSAAAPYIVQKKEKVVILHGFQNSDPVYDPAKLEQLVKSGKVKYFLVGGFGGGFGGFGGGFGGGRSKREARAISMRGLRSTAKWFRQAGPAAQTGSAGDADPGAAGTNSDPRLWSCVRTEEQCGALRSYSGLAGRRGQWAQSEEGRSRRSSPRCQVAPARQHSPCGCFIFEASLCL